jgi:hypothetical protein
VNPLAIDPRHLRESYPGLPNISIPRFVRSDATIYDFSCCGLCGTGWGGGKASEGTACSVCVCAACGTPQCQVSGLARGTCSVCLVGFLDGWGRYKSPCGYAKCKEPAIMEAPRVGQACRAHAEARGLMVKVRQRLAQRERSWRLAFIRPAFLRAGEPWPPDPQAPNGASPLVGR